MTLEYKVTQREGDLRELFALIRKLLDRKPSDIFNSCRPHIDRFNAETSPGFTEELNQRMLRVIDALESYRSTEETVVKEIDALNVFLKSYQPSSIELQNYADLQQHVMELINGEGKYKNYSVDDRQNILRRYQRSNEYALQKFQNEVQQFLRLNNAWLLPLQDFEKDSRSPLRFDQAVQALPKGYRLPYPQEEFALHKYALESGDLVAHRLVNSIWQAARWVGVAFKREGDNLIIWQDPALGYNEKKHEYEEVGQGGKRHTISVKGLAEGKYSFSSIPGFAMLYGDAQDHAAKQRSVIFIAGPEDSRWWPMISDGGSSWSLSARETISEVKMSRGVRASPRNFQ